VESARAWDPTVVSAIFDAVSPWKGWMATRAARLLPLTTVLGLRRRLLHAADVVIATSTAEADTCADFNVDVVIGLGGHRLEARARTGLVRPNVRVFEYADQWAALREADVFVTPQRPQLNARGDLPRSPDDLVPDSAISPCSPRRCEELGLAVPLSAAPQAPAEPDALRAALRRLIDDRPRFALRLAEARAWELRTIAGRGAVLDRVLALKW
jgi:hypothetical protein